MSCTARESNPGRKNGNLAWYHYTSGATAPFETQNTTLSLYTKVLFSQPSMEFSSILVISNEVSLESGYYKTSIFFPKSILTDINYQQFDMQLILGHYDSVAQR